MKDQINVDDEVLRLRNELENKKKQKALCGVFARQEEAILNMGELSDEKQLELRNKVEQQKKKVLGDPNMNEYDIEQAIEQLKTELKNRVRKLRKTQQGLSLEGLKYQHQQTRLRNAKFLNNGKEFQWKSPYRQ